MQSGMMMPATLAIGPPVMNPLEEQAAKAVEHNKLPTVITCPQCSEQTLTHVEKKTNDDQIDSIIALFTCYCRCFFWLPYTCND